MAEPASTGISAYLTTKLVGAIAGLLGGLSISFFWIPRSLQKHGRTAAGAMIGGISVGGALTLGGLIARWFNLNPLDIDTALGIGFLVGAMSVFTLTMLANYFSKREGSDLVTVVKEVRD